MCLLVQLACGHAQAFNDSCPGSTSAAMLRSPGPSVQVRVKDGRLLEGDFHCLDKLGNIILNNTDQLSDRWALVRSRFGSESCCGFKVPQKCAALS